MPKRRTQRPRRSPFVLVCVLVLCFKILSCSCNEGLTGVSETVPLSNAASSSCGVDSSPHAEDCFSASTSSDPPTATFQQLEPKDEWLLQREAERGSVCPFCASQELLQALWILETCWICKESDEKQPPPKRYSTLLPTPEDYRKALQQQQVTNTPVSDVIVPSIAVPIPPGTADALPVPKPEDDTRSKINLAAAGDGASIMAVNPGAKKAEKTIDSDDDSFMRTDCTKDKWLIIELSQLGRVESVVWSSKEMYSCRVRQLEVLGRVSHPRRDGHDDYAQGFLSSKWVLMGNFTAEKKQGTLTFKLPQPAWVKFVALRVLSHYGTDPMFAVNSIKVMGVTAAQDLEEALSKLETPAAAPMPEHEPGTAGGESAVADPTIPLMEAPQVAPATMPSSSSATHTPPPPAAVHPPSASPQAASAEAPDTQPDRGSNASTLTPTAAAADAPGGHAAAGQQSQEPAAALPADTLAGHDEEQGNAGSLAGHPVADPSPASEAAAAPEAGSSQPHSPSQYAVDPSAPEVPIGMADSPGSTPQTPPAHSQHPAAPNSASAPSPAATTPPPPAPTSTHAAPPPSSAPQPPSAAPALPSKDFLDIDIGKPQKGGNMYEAIKQEMLSLRLNQTIAWGYVRELQKAMSKRTVELEEDIGRYQAQVTTLQEQLSKTLAKVEEDTAKQVAALVRKEMLPLLSALEESQAAVRRAEARETTLLVYAALVLGLALLALYYRSPVGSTPEVGGRYLRWLLTLLLLANGVIAVLLNLQQLRMVLSLSWRSLGSLLLDLLRKHVVRIWTGRSKH